jgi:hypothetical protein
MITDDNATETRNLVLDNVPYGHVDEKYLPPTWVKVPVKVEQGAVRKGYVETEMYAGIMGSGITASSDGQSGTQGELNTMAPVVGWWITEALGPKITALAEQREIESQIRMEEIMKRIDSRRNQ